VILRVCEILHDSDVQPGIVYCFEYGVQNCQAKGHDGDDDEVLVELDVSALTLVHLKNRNVRTR